MNFKGIINALFFAGFVFVLSSLACGGVEKEFTVAKLNRAYSASAGLQMIGVILVCAFIIVKLLADSINFCEMIVEKFGKILFIIVNAASIFLNFLAIIVYPAVRGQVKDESLKVDDSYPGWCGLLIIGTLLYAADLVLFFVFGRKQNNTEYVESLPN